jgi:lambda family phage portal protein
MLGLAPKPARRRLPLRARFDSAQTTDDNSRHWAMADGLSADAAASPAIRRTLRNRSRYETANNSYARGIVDTLAHYCIGTGPRLQMVGLSRSDQAYVEGEFAAWAKAVDLADKLRTARMARTVDGEAFALLTNNDALPTPVHLDLRLIEAEQVASTTLTFPKNQVDGIRFDEAGNPIEYDILPEHPGSTASMGNYQAKPVPASDVLHLYRADRPGQRRGIPELTPALPLFAQLRRWTLSVLAAAETASDFAAIMFTDSPGESGEPEEAAAFERIEIERRAMMTLPNGWRMEQMKAEQPTSTYSDVKREIIGEIARCLSVPFNIAAGNSSDYNYASGRLDIQVFQRAIQVDRTRIVTQMLDRIFAAWIREAVLIEDYLPNSLRTVTTDWTHVWMWDGNEHVDPVKEANAQATRLSSLTTTLSDEWGKSGADWEDKLAQIARERAKLKSLGLTLGDVTAPTDAPPEPAPAPQPVAASLIERDSAGRIIGLSASAAGPGVRLRRDRTGALVGVVRA